MTLRLYACGIFKVNFARPMMAQKNLVCYYLLKDIQSMLNST